MRWMVAAAVVGICLAVWWLIHFVGWRDFEPGRHLRGHVEEIEPEGDEPITEVLPIVRDDSHTTLYDPTFYRLSNTVQEMHEVRKTGS